MASGLAEMGADVAIADVNHEQAVESAAELDGETDVFAVEVDVTDEESVQAMVTEVTERLGPIDVLVNNAGIVENSPAEEILIDSWRRVIAVNLDGVFLCSKHVGKRMLKRGDGRIVNVSSMSAIDVNVPQKQASYNATKAGVSQLTKSLAVEWGDRGVRVNAVAPGYMRTKLVDEVLESNADMEETWIENTPMGRLGRPEELREIRRLPRLERLVVHDRIRRQHGRRLHRAVNPDGRRGREIGFPSSSRGLATAPVGGRLLGRSLLRRPSSARGDRRETATDGRCRYSTRSAACTPSSSATSASPVEIALVDGLAGPDVEQVNVLVGNLHVDVLALGDGALAVGLDDERTLGFLALRPKVDVRDAPHRFDHVDDRLELVTGVGAVVDRHVLRPDAEGEFVAAAGSHLHLLREVVVEAVRAGACRPRRPSKKFIEGDLRKPATNRFAGR